MLPRAPSDYAVEAQPPPILRNQSTDLFPNGAESNVTQCRRGEAEAWDELFDRHYAAAGRFVFQLGHEFSREDTEEICQEFGLKDDVITLPPNPIPRC